MPIIPNAGVPMLPVVAGADETRRQILIYTLLLFPITLLPSLLGTTGMFYTLAGHGLGVMFIYHAIRVYRLREGQEAEIACKKLFGFSTLWLFLIFALILIERAVGIPAFAPVIG
jgi:heme o synthase